MSLAKHSHARGMANNAHFASNEQTAPNEQTISSTTIEPFYKNEPHLSGLVGVKRALQPTPSGIVHPTGFSKGKICLFPSCARCLL